MYLRTSTHEKECCHQGFIKITSGEQFVPLFCALQFPSYKGDDITQITYNNKNVIVTDDIAKRADNYYERSDNWKKKFDKVVKNNLQTILESPVVDKYCLSYYPPVTTRSSIDGYHFSVPEYGSVDYNAILGDLGLVTYTSNRNPIVVSLKSRVYSQFSAARCDRAVFTPLYLVVVKAKHLKYLRACIHTEKPVNLPYNDIKLVKENYTDNVFKNNSPIEDLKQLKVEYLDRQQLVNYLIPPQPTMNAEEYLSKAKKVIDDQRKEEQS